jgi:acyl-coenzyme A synthetase/AMP-(fatty) acid ligase
MERIEWMLKDSNAPILITQDAYYVSFSNLSCGEVDESNGDNSGKGIRILVIDKFFHSLSSNYSSENLGLNLNHSHSLMHILYTSVSTGKPKVVLLEHLGIIRLVKNTDYIRVKPGEKHRLHSSKAR